MRYSTEPKDLENLKNLQPMKQKLHQKEQSKTHQKQLEIWLLIQSLIK